MSGLFAGTPLERPVTCAVCEKPLDECHCPRDAEGNVLLPKDQTAVVRHERRSKGKTVTLVTGLDPVASDLRELLKTLKTRCGSGGTVRDGVIEIQGDHCQVVGDTLAEAGYRVRVG